MDYSKLKTVYENLTVGKRTATDDTYYYFKNDTPEPIKDWFQELSSNYNDYSFADLDEYYRVLYKLANTVSEYDNFTDDELYTIDWADDYNADRLDWLKENLNRAYWYDDIKDNGADGIFALIGDMQDRSRADFAQYICNKLESLEV